MSPEKSILWLDNDLGYITPYVQALEEVRYEVVRTRKVSQAEDLLRSRRFDLLILDVMIPTLSEAEEVVYPPGDTDNGHKTGFLFYQRMKQGLIAAGTPVLVFSVRSDRSIQASFDHEGLPPGDFVPKQNLRHTCEFMRKVQQMIQPARAAGG